MAEEYLVKIIGDATGAEVAFDKVKDKAKDTKEKVEELSDGEKALQGLTTGAMKAAFGFGTLAGAGMKAGEMIANGLKAAVKFIPDAIESTNKLAAEYQKMAIVAGMTTGEFNKIDAATRMAGGTTEDLTVIVRGMQRGIRSSSEELILNGVAADKAALSHMSFAEYLHSVMNVMHQMGDATDRDQLLLRAFERSGIAASAELENMDKHMQEAIVMGKAHSVVTAQSVVDLESHRKALAEWGMAWDKLKSSISSLFTPLANGFLNLGASILSVGNSQKEIFEASEAYIRGLYGYEHAANDVAKSVENMVEAYRKYRKELAETTKTNFSIEQMRADNANKHYIPKDPHEHEPKWDEYTQDKIRLAQQALAVDKERNLEQEKNNALDAVDLQLKENLEKFKRSKEAKDSTMLPGEYSDLQENARQNAMIARGEVEARFAMKRVDLVKEMQAKLRGEETDGFAKRLVEVDNFVDAMHKLNLKAHQEGQEDVISEAAIQASANAARARIDKDRLDMQASLQEKLTGLSGGLSKRYAEIQDTVLAIQKINQKLKDEGKAPGVSEEEIQANAAAARIRALKEETKKNVSDLKQEMSDQVKISGGMSHADQAKFFDDYLGKNGNNNAAAGAVQQLKLELHFDETAAEGAMRGLKEFATQIKAIGEQMAGFAKNMGDTLVNQLGAAFTNISTKGMTLGQAMKSLWTGMTQAMASALMQMVARQMVNWGVEQAIAAWRTAQSAKDIGMTSAEAAARASAAEVETGATGVTAAGYVTEALAARESAIAETWAAYAWMPFIGAGLAAAQIAAINQSMVAPLAVGGLISHPTLALMGEAGPEVVAPQRDFMDWANANQNLGYNLAAHNASISSLQAQTNGYGAAAQDAAGQGTTHVHLEGAVVAGSNAESARIIGNMVKTHLDAYNRRRG